MTSQQQKSSKPVEKNLNRPDYTAVNVPTKPPSDFSYVERRAEILQLVEQAGHPSALNFSELADRYEVSPQQISKDMDRLDEYIRENISHRRDLEIRSVLRRAMKGLLEEEEYYQAAKVAESYDEYLDRRINTLEFRRRLDRLERKADSQEGSQ